MTPTRWCTRRGYAGIFLALLLMFQTAVVALAAQPPAAAEPPAAAPAPSRSPASSLPQEAMAQLDEAEFEQALISLPLAAALGAALALRPKRKGTPQRMPAVVQTQIILSVVGAVIMLVVGASLARAFGIVGAANLIRYRSKIEDPKDAVVMLSALAVGLASGVGLYAIAVFSTAFLILALWIIESFERGQRQYNLTIKAGESTDELRPKFEAILRRFELTHELKSSADEQVSYEVSMPLDAKRDRVTDAILRLDPEGHASVEWAEKGKAKG
jgi:uncharacterized membrane protein YhiD involved in acid resistance